MKLATYIKQHNEGKRDFAKSVIRLSENIQYEKSYERVEKYNFVDGYPAYKYHKIIRKSRLNKPIDYIAVRVRSIKEVYAKYAYTLHLSKLNNYDINNYENMRVVETIHSELNAIGKAFDVYEFDKVTIDMFPQHNEVLEECLKVVHSVLSEIKAERKRLFEQANNAITRVLNDILPKVGLTKSEMEIVKYINTALATRTQRELNRENGTKYINRNGKSYYVSVDALKMRPKQFIAPKVLKIDFADLNQHQKDFAKKLLEVVQQEFDKGVSDNFIFDENGYIIGIKKRHFAIQMGIKESNFKNSLARIQAKYQDYRD
ncbi:hypothetical protein ACMGD3_20680 [Lysinibacillus sphaericus]|uniref:hypothetical protein n=1 Tax=Lysinibacillus sphaericus TaxID=1421 RepID=UPI003F79FA8A